MPFLCKRLQNVFQAVSLAPFSLLQSFTQSPAVGLGFGMKSVLQRSIETSDGGLSAVQQGIARHCTGATQARSPAEIEKWQTFEPGNAERTSLWFA